MITAILTLSLAFGSSKLWYDGPGHRKNSVEGWVNYAKECMNAPGFKTKNVKLRYEGRAGTRKYSSGWAYQRDDGKWVHGETWPISRDDFVIYVATDPNGNWDDNSHQTEGHEVGHMIAYNQFSEIGHPAKYRKCFKGWSDDGRFHDLEHGGMSHED